MEFKLISEEYIDLPEDISHEMQELENMCDPEHREWLIRELMTSLTEMGVCKKKVTP